MAYASQVGRGRVSSTSPQALAVCDRCGFWYNHVDLSWQMDWAGSSLINKRILVCRTCYDTPQQQLRAIVVPADPVPITQPRIEYFENAEVDNRVTSGQATTDPTTGLPVPGATTRATQLGNTRSPQATGEPPGGLNQQPGVDPGAPASIGGTNPGVPLDFAVDPPESASDIPNTGPLI